MSRLVHQDVVALSNALGLMWGSHSRRMHRPSSRC
jgi:hypothetical protein